MRIHADPDPDPSPWLDLTKVENDLTVFKIGTYFTSSATVIYFE